MLRDVWYAVRQLARAPAFGVAAVLTLALGTGANSAVFGLINGFLKPLPVPFADRLVILAAETPGDETGFRFRFSYPALRDIRDERSVFSEVVGFDTRLGGLAVDGKTTQFLYEVTTGNFFSGLGLTPAAGQFYSAPEGEQPGTEVVVVLSRAYWQKRFGGDPKIVGSIVRLDGQAARVVGVAPEGFRGMYEGTEMDGYVPIGSLRGRVRSSDLQFTDRSDRFLTLAARLQPGVPIAAAQSAVDAVARQMSDRFPVTDGHVGIRVMPEPLARPVPLRFLGRILPLIKALLVVLSSLVLAIACMNVTNLLLVRATVRAREMAIRASLGSSRARLIRLLLAESFVLAILGSAAGLLLGKWARDLLVSSIHLGISLPIVLDTTLDWTAFGYTLGLAVATGIVIGLLPALRASRASVTDLLHDGSRGDSGGAGRQRIRRWLVVAQVAGSLVLLITAGLFVRNLRQAEHIDVGFDQEQLLNVRLDPGQIGYDLARTKTFYDDLMLRLRTLPGVESVTMSFTTPLGFIFGGLPVHAEGDPIRKDQPPSAIGFNSIDPAYFETLRLPLVSGRAFSDQDTDTSTRVAIVNETLAARLWPKQNPLGKRLVIPDIDDKLWEVVGVARNSKYIAVFEDPLPYYYLPITQNVTFLRTVTLRTSVAPESLGTALSREIASLDSSLPVADMRTMRASIEGGMGFLLFRTGAMQAAALGILGLLLAVVGLYGIVSYGASQRTREIGIRLALGANPGDVRSLVLRQGATLVMGGIAAGLTLAALATTAMSKLLFIVSATDPVTFAAVTALLAAIALLACYLPARRAMRISPVDALRHE